MGAISNHRAAGASVAALLWAVFAFPQAGCSLAFVEGPPPALSRTTAAFSCTSSSVLPVVDTIVGLAGVLALVHCSFDGERCNMGSAERFGLLGGTAASFGASAVYGFSKTKKCREALRASGREP